MLLALTVSEAVDNMELEKENWQQREERRQPHDLHCVDTRDQFGFLKRSSTTMRLQQQTVEAKLLSLVADLSVIYTRVEGSLKITKTFKNI